MSETDLVERLNAYRPTDEWGDGVHHVICTEAAAEIERLRAKLHQLETAMDGGAFDRWPTGTFVGQLRMQSRDSLDPEYAQFMAATATHMGILSGQCDAMQEIMDRLRAQRDDAYKALLSIAEGNLGDQPGQANYETIKLIATVAIPPEYRPSQASEPKP